eukprot:CAMPEP_0181097288 /NCGR_PEP_ID=MMETSP1071-20121207/11486_1 /TAXON_ID=35127 /ORGANISM="Thalassiosira sp., Strain NH16" /LENGTH=253 /DNA_ID=CAMNT_0023179753 /DNA_START=769 /DNA_END=1532 /DNA_ORIENTATION=+
MRPMILLQEAQWMCSPAKVAGSTLASTKADANSIVSTVESIRRGQVSSTDIVTKSPMIQKEDCATTLASDIDCSIKVFNPYPPKLPQSEMAQFNPSAWDDANERDLPLQIAKSWDDSSLDQLFKQIDEIEEDFNTIVASLPSSEGHTTASLKSSASEHKSLKSINEKHSLVEITLNNAGSFESNSSEDSILADIADVVQRMRHIKDYIEQVDSSDEGDGSDVDDYNSQGEMSELIHRLAKAAESLRALNEWDD